MGDVEYTRADLIAICEQAIVPESQWWNRDSAGAQAQIGHAWAWLRAGCDFTVRGDGGSCSTDDRTIWVDVYARGFRLMDWGGDKDEETFYLPTPARLAASEGDWY